MNPFLSKDRAVRGQAHLDLLGGLAKRGFYSATTPKLPSVPAMELPITVEKLEETMGLLKTRISKLKRYTNPSPLELLARAADDEYLENSDTGQRIYERDLEVATETWPLEEVFDLVDSLT